MALPGLAATGGGLVESVTLSETTGLLAGGGEAAGLAVLVHGGDDPVDAGIAADGLVLRVHEDDLEVLVGRVLVDPVRVQDAQVGAAAADTLLGGRLEGALVLELVDSLVGGLAWKKEISLVQKFSRVKICAEQHTEGGTLGNWLLASTTADTDAVDNVALLGLVTQTASLVGARWAGRAVNDIQLAKLYYALSANVQRVYSRDN